MEKEEHIGAKAARAPIHLGAAIRFAVHFGSKIPASDGSGGVSAAAVYHDHLTPAGDPAQTFQGLGQNPGLVEYRRHDANARLFATRHTVSRCDSRLDGWHHKLFEEMDLRF